MINKFITDADDLDDSAKIHLDNISKHAKTAKNSTQTLLDSGSDFIDDNVDEINAQSAVLPDTIDKLVPVFDNLEDAMTEIADAVDELKIQFPDLSDEFDEIDVGISYISNAEKSIRRAISRMDDVIGFNHPSAVKKSLTQMGEAIEDIIVAMQNIKKPWTILKKSSLLTPKILRTSARIFKR